MLQFVCDVVKDTGKEAYLRPFIHIGLDWNALFPAVIANFDFNSKSVFPIHLSCSGNFVECKLCWF